MSPEWTYPIMAQWQRAIVEATTTEFDCTTTATTTAQGAMGLNDAQWKQKIEEQHTNAVNLFRANEIAEEVAAHEVSNSRYPAIIDWIAGYQGP